jgi:hypothetical protein
VSNHGVPSIDRLSLEPLYVPVKPPTGYTITNQGVKIAFTRNDARPVEGDWRTAEWSPKKDAAQILVGPGGVELTPATYSVWVRVEASPARPVMASSKILVR